MADSTKTTNDRGKPVPALVKLGRRVAGLQPGRYQVIVTVAPAGLQDWTVAPLGKVES